MYPYAWPAAPSARLAGRSALSAGRSVRPAGRSVRPAGRCARPAGRSVRPAGRSVRPAGRSIRPAGRSARPPGPASRGVAVLSFPRGNGRHNHGSHPGQPGQPGNPGQLSQPGQPGQPGRPSRPGQPGRPGHPGHPGQPAAWSAWPAWSAWQADQENHSPTGGLEGVPAAPGPPGPVPCTTSPGGGPRCDTPRTSSPNSLNPLLDTPPPRRQIQRQTRIVLSRRRPVFSSDRSSKKNGPAARRPQLQTGSRSLEAWAAARGLPESPESPGARVRRRWRAWWAGHGPVRLRNIGIRSFQRRAGPCPARHMITGRPAPANLEKRLRTRPGCVPDASHTIGFEETDASRTRPQSFFPVCVVCGVDVRCGVRRTSGLSGARKVYRK
eukprot:gene5349-biopygen11719